MMISRLQSIISHINYSLSGIVSFPAMLFLIVLFLLVILGTYEASAQGQPAPNAHYHFDNGDANDYAGTYQPSGTTDLIYHSGTRSYVEVQDTTGIITLPTSLTEDLIAQNSMELSFDIRLTSGHGAPILAAQSPISSAFWQNPGFSLSSGIGTTATLRFAYGDSTNHSESTFTNLTLDTWHSVQIIIDLNTNFWKFIVNGQANIGSFFDGFNANEFVNAIKASTFTIGGINGSRWFPHYGQIDLDEFKIFFPSLGTTNDVKAAYHSLHKDLIRTLTLTEAQKTAHLNTLKLGLPFADYVLVKDSLFAYTSKYEELNPPLFTPNTSSHILVENMPLHDQIMLFSQAHIFETRFTPENIENVNGIKFEFGELFPGIVSDTAPRTVGGQVEVNGTYNIDIAAAYGMQEFVVRPTGYYLAAGDTVTIEVSSGQVNQGLSVIVGVHFRNMEESLGATNRPADVSLEFPITSTKTKVANPYGGGLYIKVPDGTNLGWFNIIINHAVKSPYFSWRQGRKSNVTSWLNEIQSTEAPWADFESDKYMFTIPISNASKTLVPDQVMAKWDSIMDAFRFAGGRPIDTRIRAEFFTADRKLVTPAYGSGYPTVLTIPELNHVNSNWDPINVLSAPPSSILMHEMGHTSMHPTMQYDSTHACEFEAETIVHVPMAYINEVVYKMDADSAFKYSGVSSAGFSFNEAAFDWIITDNFRKNKPMAYDETAPMPDKEQLKYQYRGWAKYADLARLYSWDSVSAIFGKYYTAGVPQSSTVATACNFTFTNIAGRDEFIQYACDVTGENVAPLFHFWGINPTDSLANLLSDLPKSQKVKALIDQYLCKVAPQSLSDYTVWHNQMYTAAGYQQPRYDLYLSEFDQNYVDAINNQFTLIRTAYGLIGPSAPSNLTLNTSGHTVNLNWVDNSSTENGFIIRYKPINHAEYSILNTVGANVNNYTTSNLSAGTYEFMITAINAENLESDHCNAIKGSITLKQNQAPVITGTTTELTTNKNTPITITLTDLTVTDQDDSYPTGFSLMIQDGNNYSVSENTITPVLDYVGTLSVPAMVDDGIDNSNLFTLSISVVNQPPIITGTTTTLTTNKNTPITITLTDLTVTDQDDSYPAGFSLVVQEESNYSVSENTITPSSGFVGSLSVPVKVNDGIDNSNLFTLSISVINQPPIITGTTATFTTNKNTPVAIALTDLTVIDQDDNYPTGFSMNVQDGINYSVSGNIITPSAGFVGSLSVPITVNDGIDNSNLFTLSISVINQAPIITGTTTTFTTNKNTPVTIALTDLTVTDQDDSYPDGFVLIIEEGDDYFVSESTVTPVSDFLGTLSVPVMVNDGIDDSNVLAVTIEVTEVLSASLNEKNSFYSVFPNPAANQLTLQIQNHYMGMINIRILDISGKLLKLIKTIKNDTNFGFNVEVDRLPKGLSLIEINGTNFKKTKLVILE